MCQHAHTRGVLAAVVCTLVLLELPRGLVAQYPLPSALATITTDTGAFAPGDRDFARYTTPGWCRAAALQASDVLRGSLVAQTILDTLQDPRQDTLGTRQIAAVAQACGARFTVAGTAAPELPVLFALALLEQEDTLAQAVLARQVALAATPAAQDSLRLAALDTVLAAAPARVALAEAIVPQFDALGPSAPMVRRQAQLQAHTAVLTFWMRETAVEPMQSEAGRILALVHALPVTARTDPVVGTATQLAYRARMAVAFFTHPDAMPGIAQQAQQEPGLPQLLAIASSNSLDTVIAVLAPVDLGGGTNHAIGRPTPALRAAYWFPVGRPAVENDTVPLVRGTVSLVVLLEHLDGLGCAEHFHGGCFAPVAARVRRWLTAYGPAGLSITFVAQAWGGNALFGRLTPAAEADRLRWFVQDYWHLPVPVVVQVPGFTTLPLPDGRRHGTQSTQIAQWASHGGGDAETGDVMLTGRDGRLLAITPNRELEDDAAPFDALLRWALYPAPAVPVALAPRGTP